MEQAIDKIIRICHDHSHQEEWHSSKDFIIFTNYEHFKQKILHKPLEEIYPEYSDAEMNTTAAEDVHVRNYIQVLINRRFRNSNMPLPYFYYISPALSFDLVVDKIIEEIVLNKSMKPLTAGSM